MSVESFIEPHEVEVGGKTYTLSKIPAFQAKKVYSALVVSLRESGEIGRTLLPEDAVRTLLKYVGARDASGDWAALDNTAFIESALASHRDFVELQLKQQEYNFSFLIDGSLRSLLALPEEGAAASGL